jgi:hypothetical protein
MHALRIRLALGWGAVLVLPAVMAQDPAGPQKDAATTESGKPGQEIQARCRPLSGEFRAVCEARVMGSGGTSGSLPRSVEIVVLPPGADRTRIEPQTSPPTVVVPAPAR